MLNEEQNPYTRPPIFSFKVNITKVRNWWVNRKRKKRMRLDELYEWIYECGCKAGAKHLSNPY